jgi:two-component system response regulator YesN
MAMYKVLLVDDEMIVRVGLRSLIRWEDYGFTICGEAKNGIEALKLVEAMTPDVILTDIRMPKMDGIELIQQLFKRRNKAKIIVLSCLNEFDVLQQAYRLGAKEYFLKLSFDSHHLIELLQRMGAELHEVRNHQVQQPKQPSYHVNLTLKEDYYRSAIRDKLNVLRANHDVRCQIQGDQQFVFLVRQDRPWNAQQTMKLEGNLLKSSILNILEEVLGKDRPTDVVELEGGTYLAVCDINTEGSKDTIYLLAQEVQQSLLRFLNISVSIGVYPSFRAKFEFYQGYVLALQALEHKFITGHKSIIFSEQVFSQQSESIPAFPEENLLMEWLTTSRFDAAREMVLERIMMLSEQLRCKPNVVKLHLSELVFIWLRVLKQYGGSWNEADERLMNPLHDIPLLETLEDIRHWVVAFTMQIEKRITEITTIHRNRAEIVKSRRYVEQHYAREISVKEVARHIGLNPAYFSHLFKKETGQGFAEYVSQHRIQQAQKLLRETSRSISEICDLAGFSDVAYFRRVFKQQTGMTPTEYRDQTP